MVSMAIRVSGRRGVWQRWRSAVWPPVAVRPVALTIEPLTAAASLLLTKLLLFHGFPEEAVIVRIPTSTATITLQICQVITTTAAPALETGPTEGVSTPRTSVRRVITAPMVIEGTVVSSSTTAPLVIQTGQRKVIC